MTRWPFCFHGHPPLLHQVSGLNPSMPGGPWAVSGLQPHPNERDAKSAGVTAPRGSGATVPPDQRLPHGLRMEDAGRLSALQSHRTNATRVGRVRLRTWLGGSGPADQPGPHGPCSETLTPCAGVKAHRKLARSRPGSRQPGRLFHVKHGPAKITRQGIQGGAPEPGDCLSDARRYTARTSPNRSSPAQTRACGPGFPAEDRAP
jgi:hypothetical protein